MKEQAIDSKVTDALRSLVEHYQQPIHWEASSESSVKQALQKSCALTFGSVEEIAPIVRVRAQTLASSFKEEPRKNVTCKVYTGYEEWIRPTLFSTESSYYRLLRPASTILLHYRMLLSCLLDPSKEEQQHVEIISFGDRTEDDTIITILLNKTLRMIATDITKATAVQVNEDEARVRFEELSVVLHVLLCLLEYGLVLNERFELLVEQATIQRIACSLLAFGSTKVNLQQIDSEIEEALSNLDPCCSFPKLIDIVGSIRIKNEILEDSSVQLDASYWDREKVLGHKAALVWTLLAKTLSDDNSQQVQAAEESISFVCNNHSMSGAVRAHFFGRDMEEVAVVKTRSRLFMGRTVTETVQDPQKAFKIIPSRVHVAVRYLSILETVNQPLLDNVIPICYELLTSPSDAHMGMGAACLFRLLHCPVSPPDDSKNLWGLYADNLLSFLDLIVKTCRNGPTLALTGLAQRRLFLLLTTRGEECSNSQRRRQATLQWLTIMDQNRHHDKIAPGILIGAVLPLLHDHALHINADGLELGRLGLMALLPLLSPLDDEGSDLVVLGVEHHGEQSLMVALLALSNLFMAAHPIMPRHAGKILCTLIALAACSTDTPQLRTLAVHVAGMALVVCGDPGQSLLNRLQVDTKYEDRLKTVIGNVRDSVHNLQATTQSP